MSEGPATGVDDARLKLLEHTPGALFSFDAEGRIASANPAMHRLVGAEPGSLPHTRVEALLTVAGRVFYSTHVFPLLRLQGRVDEIYLQLLRKGAEALPVMLSALRHESDGTALYYGALMPMGQREQLERALLEARKAAEAASAAKDQFLAVVSHELRSPLGAIMGWAHMGQAAAADPALQARAFETIERNAQAQARLIDDLLDVSRIVSGKMRLSPRPIDIATVLDHVVDNARPSAQMKNIDLSTAIERRTNTVFADPDRIQQIAWNLVSNAIKFTPKNGHVQVTLGRVESRLRLEVADNGPGIAPAQLPHVFERFWQAEDRPGHSAGLGLGLAICKNLVELHGGTIRAESPASGGACFTVELPLAVAAAGQQAFSVPNDAPQADEALKGLHVQVVDDDADARGLMRMLLEAAGAKVTAADSTREALLQMSEAAPDVLLSDIGLAGEDGYALIRRLRAGEVPGARQVPAVAVTGLSRSQDRISLLRAGFQAHLVKPFEPSEAVALINALAKKS